MDRSEPVATASTYYTSSLTFLILSVLSAGANYAYYPVISRFLTTSDFGTVQVLIAIASQVGALFAGLNAVMIYLVNKLGAAEATNAIEILQGLTIRVFLLSSLAVGLFHAPILRFLHIDRPVYIALLALALVTTIPFITAFGTLQATRQFSTAGVLQLSVVTVKLIAGAILVRRFGASGALLGIAAGQILGMLGFWAIGSLWKIRLWDHNVLAGLTWPSAGALGHLRPLATHVLSIVFVNVTLFIYISFSAIAARHYFSANASGLFIGANTIASVIIFVSLPLIGVLLPHLSAAGLASSMRSVLRTAAMVAVVSVCSVICLGLYGGHLLQILGRDYAVMNYLMIRLGVMVSLLAGISLAMQVGAFYAPARTALVAAVGLLGLVAAAMQNHVSLTSLVSTMTAVLVAILLVSSLQIIWMLASSRETTQM